jgi:hypothetical protein|tara:strand:- start:28 stop:306 length:279 start_codon:yes stop_codon:yes gene_type:complete
MDFLEELDLYHTAMHNAYNVITGKISIEEVYMELEEGDEDLEFPLPFNPFLHEDISSEEIGWVIDHFIELEDYEKCQELLDSKNAIDVKRDK